MKEIDAFSGLLEGPRARGAFTLRAFMEPPWCLRVEAESPLTVIAMVRGEAWILPDRADPLHLKPGDVAITRATEHYRFADDPATEPSIVIHPGEECRSLTGESMEAELMHDVRTWGNDPRGSTRMLIGAYESMADISARLLDSLPPFLVVKNEHWDSPLVGLLFDEVGKDAPGQAAVLDRLLDLLLIAILRTWFARPARSKEPWYQAKGDPVVARALKTMHRRPDHPWTLARLATEVGVSRAALARRFHETVGEPPMAFLTSWRLALAADLLCEPGETVGTVAERVGYGSPYALSTAFKRVRGVSPQQHRERVLAAG